MLQVYDGVEIVIRDEDGYWDATAMSKKFGKQTAKFLSAKQTQDYIKVLAKNMSVDESFFVEIARGGKEPKTWMHRRLALKFAAWLNPDFEVWVYGVIEKLLTEGEVRLKDEIKGLTQALGIAEEQIELLNNETGLMQYAIDQLKYENDALAEIAGWRQSNSWGGLDV